MAIPRFTIGHISDNTRVTLINAALHCTVNNNHVTEILHYYAHRHNGRNAHPCTRSCDATVKSKPGAGEHGRHQIWAQAALQVCIAYVGWFYVHSGFNLLQSVGYVVISGHKTDDTRRNKRL